MLLKRPNDFILFALIAYIVAMTALIMMAVFSRAHPTGNVELPFSSIQSQDQ